MSIRASLLLCLGLCASAQISNLRSDATGSAVYFSTSARIVGSGQYDWPKLFVLDEHGPRLYEQRLPAPGTILTNAYQLQTVEFGGSARMIVGAAACKFLGSSCFLANKIFTEVGMEWFNLSTAGQGQLSGNGRYLLTCCGDGLVPLDIVRTDLTTGGNGVLGSRPVGGGRWIASNGNALAIPWKSGLNLIHADGTAVSITRASPTWASLSDDGSAVTLADVEGGLWLWSESGGLRALGVRGSSAALSPDARRLAFISEDHQLHVCDTSLCLPMPWTDVPEGIVEFTWSGDGHVLFAAGKWGRVLRIDVDRFTVAQWMEGMPQVKESIVLLSPGSTYEFPGWFAAGDLPTYARIGNNWVRPLDVTNDRLVLQVPWGTTPGDGPVYIVGPHPFELKIAEQVAPNQARLAAASHEDFRGLISDADPARLGEVLHLFMQGLGTPLITLADGEPAPVDRTIGVVPPWKFQTFSGVTNGFVPLETLFVGMAPGMIGIYQADVRLLTNWPDPWMGLYCTATPNQVFLLGRIPVE